MTQEDNDLLLKDLSARVPYGIKAQVKYPINTNGECIITTKEITSVNCGLGMVQAENIDIIVGYYTFEVRPYLFPLESMTEEQQKYINDRWGINENFDFEIDPNWGKYFVDLGDAVEFIEWLNENYFDYRGLIPKGLAKDATGKNIY